MRFSERDRPRPKRQEDYEDYRERDLDSGWPYDDTDDFRGPRRNAPYGEDGEGRLYADSGFHDADERYDRPMNRPPLRRDRPPARRADAGPDHRGKGPKGYRRSDERIRDDVSDLLTDEAQIDPSDVEVSVKDGEVTLQGLVGKRFERRLAEDWAESVSGVVHVQNNIRVRSPE